MLDQRALPTIAAAISLALAACSNGTTGITDAASCVPGRAVSCTCDGGASGASMCGATGVQGSCVCTGGIDAGGFDVGADATEAASQDASSDAPPASLMFQVSTAPSTGSVTGRVFDLAAGAPVGGAIVSSGVLQTVSASDGTFSLTVPTGRALVAVAAPGYFNWSSETSAGSVPRTLDVGLIAQGIAQTVGPTATTLTVGAAMLEVPAGSFSGTASINAAWVSGTAVHSLGIRTNIMDPTHSFGLQVVGVLQAEVSAEPMMPVLLHVPVPASATSAGLFVAERAADGTRGVPIPPMGLAGGVATFALPHLSAWDLLAHALLPPGRPQGFTVVATYQNGNAGPNGTGYSTDDTIDPGTPITLPPGAAIVVQDARGNQFTFRGESPNWSDATDETVTVGSADGMLLRAIYDHYTSGSVIADYVRQWALPASSSDTPTQQPDESSQPAVEDSDYEVTPTGTVFSVTGDPCPMNDGMRSIQNVEADDGMVVLQTTTSSSTVVAGQQATGCEGCAHPSDPPVCCDANNCAMGCCQPMTTTGGTMQLTCQPGNTSNACGQGGSMCEDCGTAACSNGRCPPCQSSDCTGVVCPTSAQQCFEYTCNPDGGPGCGCYPVCP